MFEISKNLCKSVIEQELLNRHWQDDVYLAEACKERFIVSSEIPELISEEISMAGLEGVFTRLFCKSAESQRSIRFYFP